MKKTILPYRFIKLVTSALIATCVLLTSFSESRAAKKSKRGWLGVHVQELTPSLREAFDVGKRPGLLISDVVKASPADKADLDEEDVILTFDGQPVEKADEFAKMVRETPPGKTVKMVILREGEEEKIEVKIGKRKTRRLFRDSENVLFIKSSGPKLGVKVHKLNEDLAAYFHVKRNEGVLLLEVIEDSPAEEAGIRAGDIITRVNDERVTEPDELIEALEEFEEGDVVTIEYVRHAESAKVEIKLEDFDEESSFMWNFFKPPHIDIHRFDRGRSHDIEIQVPKHRDRFDSILREFPDDKRKALKVML